MANSAQFDGGTILHHVTNWRDDVWIPLNMFGVDLSITKHVLMLWIVASITIALTLYATRAYRKNINAKPKGIAHLYEILLEFVSLNDFFLHFCLISSSISLGLIFLLPNKI